MFEIDLLTGAQGTGARSINGASGKRRSPGPPSTLRGILLNRWVLGSCVVVLGVLGISTRLALGTSKRIAHLDAALQEAIQDSVRVAEQLRTRSRLESRHDSLATRAALIEQADARRFDWPHLLEEIAVAVPEGVWITRIGDVAPGWQDIRLRVEGQTSDNAGLTRFWHALEASFFIENVELLSAGHRTVQGPEHAGDARDPYRFVIEADWETPPHDLLNFVPFAEVGT